jgi:hypothetical protein
MQVARSSTQGRKGAKAQRKEKKKEEDKRKEKNLPLRPCAFAPLR